MSGIHVYTFIIHISLPANETSKKRILKKTKQSFQTFFNIHQITEEEI